jgi:hypothetical protein
VPSLGTIILFHPARTHNFAIVRRLVIKITLICEAHTLVLQLPHGARSKQAQHFCDRDFPLQHYILVAAVAQRSSQRLKIKRPVGKSGASIEIAAS